MSLIYNIKESIGVLEEKVQAVDVFQRSKALGIYFGQDRVTVVQISRGFLKMKIRAGYSFPNPLTLIPGSPLEEEEKLIAEIMTCIDRTDGDWDKVIIGIPRHHVIFKRISVPAPNRTLIPDILKYEIERHVPFNPEETYYFYQVISKTDENTFNVHLTAVRDEIVEYYMDLSKQAGVAPSVIDVSTMAVTNMLMFNFPDMKIFRDGNAVLLHREESNIDISLIRNGEFILSRSIQLGIDKYEETGDDEKYDAFVAEEINKTIANYTHWVKGGDQPTPLILLGMESLRPDMIEELESRTGLQTKYFNESVNVKKSKIKMPPKRKKMDIGLLRDITALGLALRGLTRTPMYTNLMPKSFRVRYRPYGGFITLGLMTSVAVLLSFLWISQYLQDKTQLNYLSTKLIELKDKARIVEDLYLKNEQLESKLKIFENLKQSKVSKLNVLKELTGLFSSEVWIKNIEIMKEGFEMQGYASSASPLINIIEESDLFKNAQFIGRITNEKGKEKFKLTARFEQLSAEVTERQKKKSLKKKRRR